MINIEGAAGLAKCAINHIVIAINNSYQTAVSKASYLITTDTGDTFSVSWCLANSLDTTLKLEINLVTKIETSQLLPVYLL